MPRIFAYAYMEMHTKYTLPPFKRLFVYAIIMTPTEEILNREFTEYNTQYSNDFERETKA